MLQIVTERGLHEAPMSLLAERSGASAGVIYHHFQSKEELLQALYERVRSLKRTLVFEGYDPQMEAREGFIRVWTNVYREHLPELRFLEQYELAGLAGSSADPVHDPQELELLQRFTSRSKGGDLNELPPEIHQELSLGVATRLARMPAPLDADTLRRTAESIWESIRARN